MNPSFDLVMLCAAVAIVLLASIAAARTRSNGMRFRLLTIAAVMIAPMLWNLATHGGFRAV